MSGRPVQDVMKKIRTKTKAKTRNRLSVYVCMYICMHANYDRAAQIVVSITTRWIWFRNSDQTVTWHERVDCYALSMYYCMHLKAQFCRLPVWICGQVKTSSSFVFCHIYALNIFCIFVLFCFFMLFLLSLSTVLKDFILQFLRETTNLVSICCFR